MRGRPGGGRRACCSAAAADEPAALAPAKACRAKVKAKSVIQIFLWGGMSHNDTWDPKPEAGRDYMGEFSRRHPHQRGRASRSASCFPKLAKQADKYSLIRSMTHRNNGHETAAYLMQTGHTPGERLAYPSIGAVFALFKGPDYKGLIPPYVVLTQAAGAVLRRGLPGAEVQAVRHRRRPERRPLRGGRRRRPGHHRRPAEGPPRPARQAEHDGPRDGRQSRVGGRRGGRRPAYELILGKGKEVFDLSKEKPELRDRYGRHTFGQECLVARRMVETGVPYVVINYPGGWDTHSNHFADHAPAVPATRPGPGGAAGGLEGPRPAGEHARLVLRRVRPRAQGRLAAALERRPQPLRQRLHACWSPAADSRAATWSASSDAKAEEVKDRPVYPVDLLGSIYQLGRHRCRPPGCPIPMGLEAHVLPRASEGVKSAGLLDGDHVAEGALQVSIVRRFAILSLAGSILLQGGAAFAQPRPYIGYVYPAGGQQGTTARVRLGGQQLDAVDRVIVSGAGVEAESSSTIATSIPRRSSSSASSSRRWASVPPMGRG